MRQRGLLVFLFGIIIAYAAGSVRAADLAAAYPSRPIRIIAPTTPGGANDILPRLLAPRLSASLGQQIVVDVRPGAGGIVGTEMTARAVADGHTLIVVANGYALNPYLYDKLPYDTLKDLERVTLFAVAPLVLVVHPTVPANSLGELTTLLKARPGQLNYGSSGAGSGGWLSAQLYRRMAGIEMTHIPYKGAGQATTAVVSGEVNLLFTSSLPAAPHIISGRLRALGVTSAKRVSSMESVPAMGESIPGYEVLNFFGVLATGGTPKPILAKLYREIARVTAQPDIRERLEGLGFEVVDQGPDQFTAFVKAEMAKWSKVFVESGIKPTGVQ
jgi:tripartite-type tricarboxylate transporter receptor subunit TctC